VVYAEQPFVGRVLKSEKGGRHGYTWLGIFSLDNSQFLLTLWKQRSLGAWSKAESNQCGLLGVGVSGVVSIA